MQGISDYTVPDWQLAPASDDQPDLLIDTEDKRSDVAIGGRGWGEGLACRTPGCWPTNRWCNVGRTTPEAVQALAKLDPRGVFSKAHEIRYS